MAIPSKVAFEYYLNNSKWVIPPKIAEEIGAIIEPTRDSILYYLNLLDGSYEEHHRNLNKSEVYSWIKSQENFKRSTKSIFRNVKFIPYKFKNKAEYMEYRVNEIFDSFDRAKWSSYPSGKAPSSMMLEMDADMRVKFFTYWFSYSKQLKLLDEIVKCFYDYFYTERATEIYKAKLSANKVLRQLESNLEEFMGLVKFDEFLAYKDKYLFAKQTKIFVEKIKQQRFEIPFERNDKTLKERVLIYDLNKVLIKYFKTPKPNGIFYLLMLEGVKNNIEKRGIERMIARWNNGTKD